MFRTTSILLLITFYSFELWATPLLKAPEGPSVQTMSQFVEKAARVLTPKKQDVWNRLYGDSEGAVKSWNLPKVKSDKKKIKLPQLPRLEFRLVPKSNTRIGGGTGVGDGGDDQSGELNELGLVFYKLAKLKSKTEKLNFDLTHLKWAIDNTKVTAYPELELNERDIAANFYRHISNPKIKISNLHYDKLAGNYFKKLRLAAHEYLSVAGYDDKNYQISNPFFNRDVCLRSIDVQKSIRDLLGMRCGAITEAHLQNIHELSQSEDARINLRRKKLHAFDFFHLSNLESLEFTEDSAYFAIPNFAFSYLKNLEYAKLAGLKVLHKESLTGSRDSLKTLFAGGAAQDMYDSIEDQNAVHNTIVKLAKGSLRDMIKLEALTLGVRAEYYPEALNSEISQLEGLTVLRLAGTGLNALSTATLAKLKKLSYLSLSFTESRIQINPELIEWADKSGFTCHEEQIPSSENSRDLFVKFSCSRLLKK